MQWRSKTIRGTVYDLSHLHPFRIEVRPKAEGAPSYPVQVTFGFHCFTRECEASDTPDLHMQHLRETRSFCPTRYELSKELVGMIKYAANGPVYFGEKSNFLIVESMSQHNAPYVAFFDIEPVKRTDSYAAAMFVTSALISDRSYRTNFRRLVSQR